MIVLQALVFVISIGRMLEVLSIHPLIIVGIIGYIKY